MNSKRLLIPVLVASFAIPLSGIAKDKKKPERGMVEKMDAVPCGAKQRGLSGLGSFWASVGITRVNSDEKLCPEYLVRTDDTEYHVRPTDMKHAVLLPVGHEGTFRMKNDQMLLQVEDGGDGKTRSYKVVAVKPTNEDSTQTPSGKAAEKQP
jgi:hypothetical protein